MADETRNNNSEGLEWARVLVSMLLVTVSACFQGSTDESSLDPAGVKAEVDSAMVREQDLDHYVERVLAEQGVPGMSIAVVRGGEILQANIKGHEIRRSEGERFLPMDTQVVYSASSRAGHCAASRPWESARRRPGRWLGGS